MKATESKPDLLEAVVALAKRRGFIFQGSEIYGGLAGTWDWGPLGVVLKNNIKQSWWKRFVESREDIFPVDTAILMNQKVWQASGHVGGFADPLVECNKCHKSFRADHVTGDVCPECGKGKLEARQPFNMMFKTQIGVGEGENASVSYLRPETAQGMFVNFKNIIDSLHPRLPFGMAQIGKAFRNEIAPRDFLFRSREFEQMEIEYFLRESDWEKSFEMWRVEMKNWLAELGLGAGGGKNGVGTSGGEVHELEVPAEDRAHYSKRTIDFEFDFPFGRKELCGLAYRTDFDLRNHSTASGVDLSYFDEQTGERFIPHVIEPTVGVDRLALALLCSALKEDTMGDGGAAETGAEKRIFLQLPPEIAPVRIAVFPLLKNKPELVAKAREVYDALRKAPGLSGCVAFDDNGNIGKRYRRQDEIGTPECVTIDFQTLEDQTVTVRDRDTGGQKRVAIGELMG